jgi:signal recognition particle subunit SRP54
MGDVAGLIDRVSELGLDDNEELLSKIRHGNFSLRDMYEQFMNIQKLGPFGQIMNMIPGMGGDMIGKAGEEESTRRLKRCTTIMESMHSSELDSTNAAKLFKTQPSRVFRVARGAGVKPNDIMDLLAQYGKFSQLVKKMGGMKNLFSDKPNAKVNPKQMNEVNMHGARLCTIDSAIIPRLLPLIPSPVLDSCHAF